MANELTNVTIDPEKLKKARGLRKIEEVANLIGVTSQQLWNYENGFSGVPGHRLARLCILYNVPITALTNINKKNLEQIYNAA